MVVFAAWAPHSCVASAQILQTRLEVTVASASLPKDKRSARIAIVEQHIRLENEHDLEGVLNTFGNSTMTSRGPNTILAATESACSTSS